MVLGKETRVPSSLKVLLARKREAGKRQQERWALRTQVRGVQRLARGGPAAGFGCPGAGSAAVRAAVQVMGVGVVASGGARGVLPA